MPRFGFCGPTYQSESVDVDAQRCMNWYPEIVESGAGATAVALYPTWGLKLFGTPNDLGVFVSSLYSFNQRLFGTTGGAAVSMFFELDSNGVVLGSGRVIVGDGNPATMAANNANQLAICSGQTLNWQNMTDNSWHAPTVGPVQPPVMVDFIDGYFLVLMANSQFQYSNLLDGDHWDPTNVFQVSLFPENVVSMLVVHRDIWMWSPKHCVVYANTGDPLNPFQPIPGAFIEQGITAIWSPICLNNQVFWIGARESGEGVAFTAQGWTPQRVSNHAVETAWQRYPRIDDAVSTGWQIHGHSVWQIYFPTADATWRLDVDSGMWYEAGYWDAANGKYHAHRSRCHCYTFNKHFLGDTQSRNVYQMSPDFYDDNGNPIRRFRRAPHVSNELEWSFHHKLRVHLETGLGPQPPLVGNSEGPSVLSFQSADGIWWQAGITDAGTIITASYGPGGPFPLYTFVDLGFYPYQITCYVLGMTPSGSLYLIPPAPPPALPIITGFIKRLPMITGPTSLQTDLSVVDGNIIVEPPYQATREPQIMLRHSNDGAHTWSNEYMLGCGMSGDFTKRVEWRGLGRSRDRVYEISVTDPIAWRIIDAYLFASPTPGPGPQERYATQMAKVT